MKYTHLIGVLLIAFLSFIAGMVYERHNAPPTVQVDIVKVK